MSLQSILRNKTDTLLDQEIFSKDKRLNYNTYFALPTCNLHIKVHSVGFMRLHLAPRNLQVVTLHIRRKGGPPKSA